VEELEQRGHRAVAVDLPAGDPDAGALRYAAVAAEAGSHLHDPVVVGHSLAGLVIGLLPGLLPVSELVFLCAPLPVPGLSLQTQQELEPDIFVRENLQPDSMRPGKTVERTEESAVAAFYHDCSAAEIELALARLRPQATLPMTEPSPVTRWPPNVPCRYILCRDDRILNPAWSRRAVPERLGVVPVELEGSHSPFLSRPRELVDALLG
jgi:pimeloyl-ACP methyl ester carboxylesterase